MSATVVATHTLIVPIQVELKRAGADARTETITELQIHAFKARDLRALDGLGENAHGSMTLALIARLVRQPVQVVEEMGAEDLSVMQGHVERFLPSGQKTGATEQGT